MAIGRRKLDDRPGKLAWDFENGCMVLEDRVRTDSGDWEIQQRKVENDKFRAVIDLPNIERGWIAFVKGEGLNRPDAGRGRNELAHVATERCIHLGDEAQPFLVLVAGRVAVVLAEPGQHCVRTFHVPLFKIRGWVPRPPELPARASRSLGAPRKRTAMSRPRTGSRDRRPRTSSEARSHFSWGQ
jgi:hypothetical protein